MPKKTWSAFCRSHSAERLQGQPQAKRSQFAFQVCGSTTAPNQQIGVQLKGVRLQKDFPNYKE